MTGVRWEPAGGLDRGGLDLCSACARGDDWGSIWNILMGQGVLFPKGADTFTDVESVNNEDRRPFLLSI